jgi:hypothetical protein
MVFQVRVVRLNENVEEEADVEVRGHALTCFVAVCPYRLAPGEVYPARLSLWALEGLEVREADGEVTGISRIGDDFRHRVVGILHGSVLDAGVAFEDELFLAEYEYLDGRVVSVDVDRIQLAFE